MTQLVLSLFPGIGLLDMAFEQEGFCVVRGPDVLWGGDVRNFHPPAGKFDGVIGGPPCQSHCTYAALNRAQGKNVREDLVPEFVRIVMEVSPNWALMENAPNCPLMVFSDYDVQALNLNARSFGCEQNRERRFQWAYLKNVGRRFYPEIEVFEPTYRETVCMASEGRSGKLRTVRVDGRPRTRHSPRRDPARFCRLQGLPGNFMEQLPFTNEWKYRVVGNGVPLPMGRAIAKAVKEATE